MHRDRTRARRYRGPLRQYWLSFCSHHTAPVKGCPQCRTGEWRSVWLDWTVAHLRAQGRAHHSTGALFVLVALAIAAAKVHGA